MTHVVIMHDHSDFAETQAEILTKFHGINTEFYTSAAQSLKRVKRGLNDVDAVVIHKDLGMNKEPISSTTVIEMIHDTAPHIRIGLISGEFPNGEKHVKAVGGDFYLHTRDMALNRNWLLEQLSKGWLSPDEQQRRGEFLAMPTIGSLNKEII